jgi:hypothetical protein
MFGSLGSLLIFLARPMSLASSSTTKGLRASLSKEDPLTRLRESRLQGGKRVSDLDLTAFPCRMVDGSASCGFCQLSRREILP